MEIRRERRGAADRLRRLWPDLDEGAAPPGAAELLLGAADDLDVVLRLLVPALSDRATGPRNPLPRFSAPRHLHDDGAFRRFPVRDRADSRHPNKFSRTAAQYARGPTAAPARKAVGGCQPAARPGGAGNVARVDGGRGNFSFDV